MPDDFDEETKVPSQIGIPTVPRASERDRPYLIVLVGSSVGEMYKLTKGTTVIGRGPGVDFQLNDDGVSRRHVQLVRKGDEIQLVDLASTNGTFCNGERIAQHTLRDGDKIQVGSTTILKFSFH